MRHFNRFEVLGIIIVIMCGGICFFLSTQIELDSKSAIRIGVNAITRVGYENFISEQDFSAADHGEYWYILRKSDPNFPCYDEEGHLVLKLGGGYAVKIKKKGGVYLGMEIHD